MCRRWLSSVWGSPPCLTLELEFDCIVIYWLALLLISPRIPTASLSKEVLKSQIFIGHVDVGLGLDIALR